MAIKDSPTTRIKARDAEKAWKLAPEAPAYFLREVLDQGFCAAAAIHFNGAGRKHGLICLSDADARGSEILGEYLQAVIDRAAPEVRDAEGAVLLALGRDGIAEVATWGRGARDCRILGRWGGRELEALPASPFQTWFGYGAQGKPTPLTPAQLATLTPTQRAWVEARTR